MTNFIFKSSHRATDLQKISQQLLIILNNQRYARNDLAILTGKVNKIFNALALQKQVDDYFDKDEEPVSRQEVEDLD